MITHAAGVLVAALTRLVTAVRAEWVGCPPSENQRIYFANHTSHGDFVLIWSILPPELRRRTRPVAAADYWQAGPLRRFVSCRVFDAVLVDRSPTRTRHPLERARTALDAGASLIVFPEGTRNTTGEPLLPFKSGVFHLARMAPRVEFVPVWIENLHRVMPKGEFLLVPLLCSVAIGVPQRLVPGETRDAFVKRLRTSLLELAHARGAGG